jgi:adenylate kinase family enzyme
MYHAFRPSKKLVFATNGGSLYQREDDREETTARLRFTKTTAPLIKYYREQGLLREIDMPAASKARRQVIEALGSC